jgi:hypothetical protein
MLARWEAEKLEYPTGVSEGHERLPQYITEPAGGPHKMPPCRVFSLTPCGIPSSLGLDGYFSRHRGENHQGARIDHVSRRPGEYLRCAAVYADGVVESGLRHGLGWRQEKGVESPLERE